MCRNNVIPFRPKKKTSSVSVSTCYGPRTNADSSSVYRYEGKNRFKLSMTVSRSITPEQMAQTGTAMIHLGASPMGSNAAFRAKCAVPDKSFGPFKEQGQQIIYGRVVRDEWKEDPLTNFVVELTGIVKRIGPDYVETLLGFDVLSPTTKRKGMIPLKDYISKMSKLIREQWPEFRLYDIGKNPEKLFQEYLSRIYSECREALSYCTVYMFSGWNDDKRYLSGSDPDCESDRILPDISGLSASELYKWNYRILTLSKNLQISVILVIQFHTDVLLKLFMDAGSSIQHITGYVGPTGSRKTAVAKILHGCSFNIETVVNFTATNAGIDLMIKLRCRDGTLVMDNLNNSTDKTQQHSLDQVTLQVGDSDGRIKTSNGGKALVQGETRVAIVFTAESHTELAQLSNRIRELVTLFTKDSIDNDVLLYFQRDRKLSKLRGISSGLDQYKAAFIKYVENHYDEIVEFVAFFQPPEFPLRFARQARTYKNLVAIAAIILKFGEDCGALSAGQCADIMEKEWLPAIQEVMRYNEMLCFADEPYKLFLKAIVSGVAQKLFPVALNKEIFQTKSTLYFGFWDGQILKIDPTRAYGYVVNFYRAKVFTATAGDIWTALRDKGISDGYADKGKKAASLFKKVKINGTQIEMVCLKWAEVEKIVCEEENQ